MLDINLKIKGLINSGNLSVKELSEKIDKSSRTIYNYIEGKTVIDVDTLSKIASVYRVSPKSFFEDEDIEMDKQKDEDIQFLNKKIDELYNVKYTQEEKIKTLKNGIESAIKTFEEINSDKVDINYFREVLKVTKFDNSIEVLSFNIKLRMLELKWGDSLNNPQK